MPPAVEVRPYMSTGTPPTSAVPGPVYRDLRAEPASTTPPGLHIFVAVFLLLVLPLFPPHFVLFSRHINPVFFFPSPTLDPSILSFTHLTAPGEVNSFLLPTSPSFSCQPSQRVPIFDLDFSVGAVKRKRVSEIPNTSHHHITPWGFSHRFRKIIALVLLRSRVAQ